MWKKLSFENRITVAALVLYFAFIGVAFAQTTCTTWCDDYGYCYTECW